MRLIVRCRWRINSSSGVVSKSATDKKLRGEWAEMVFMTRAIELGLPISKPWGEMQGYDFVVGRTGRFVSVQVKSHYLRSRHWLPLHHAQRPQALPARLL